MANEEIIQISPEEELTSVRERLERVQAKKIILVVQQQTQLRSYVGWRLLYAQVRDLGKDVLVICPDRQIRTIVKNVGFKVAESQEASPSSKSPPRSRSSRTASGRPSAHLRSSVGKSTAPAENRSGSSGQAQPGSRRREPSQQPVAPPSSYATDPEMSSQDYVVEADEIATTDLARPLSSIPAPPPAEPSRSYGSTYGFQGEAASPNWQDIGAGPPAYEEEPDQLAADYDVTQRFWGSIQPQRPAVSSTMPPQPQPTQQPFNMLSASPSYGSDDDALDYLEDIQPTSLPEQHASLPFTRLDESGPDIADYPTDVDIHGEFEDLGDEGDFVARAPQSPQPQLPPRRPAGRPWGLKENRGEIEQDVPDLARGRSRDIASGSNRRENMLTGRSSENDELIPPAVADQPTYVLPSAPAPTAGNVGIPFPNSGPGMSASARSAGGASTQPSQGLPPLPLKVREPQLVPPKPHMPGATQTGKRPAVSPGSRPTRGAFAPKKARRRGRSGFLVGLGIVALVAVLLLVLVYVVPSADVTITLPSQPLSLSSVKLLVPAQSLAFDASVSGTGQTSGTTQVGNAVAQGTVIFTNKGSVPIDIPSNTTVETDNGVQFLTIADVVVNVSSNPAGNTNLTTIMAVSAGESGNVAAGSITVIPSTSLTKIAQSNTIPVSAVSLAVTNSSATVGGGAAPAAAVSKPDIQKEQAVLDGQIQTQLQQWLAQNVHAHDVLGTTIHLDRLQPLETVITTPALGSVAPKGTFTEVVKLHLPVLVARAADVQAAASTQLNLNARQHHPGYALAADQQPTWDMAHITATPTADGKSIALTLNVTGQIALSISEDTVRGWVSGKSVDAARSYLASKKGDVRNVVVADIQVSPGFFPWMPLLSGRIDVHFKSVVVK